MNSKSTSLEFSNQYLIIVMRVASINAHLLTMPSVKSTTLSLCSDKLSSNLDGKQSYGT